MTYMILNENRSILLPNFDTSTITENDLIKEIVLNLYVNKFDNKSLDSGVHLTINPYDQKTSTIREGLSAIYHPESNHYLEIRLPKSLFEEIIETNERLLLKMVGKDKELIFNSSESIKQDPFLSITYIDGVKKQPDGIPTVINNNFNFGSIDNSQLHFGNGDNVARNKIINPEKKERVISKFFWYFIIPIVVAFIVYKLGFN